MLNVVDLSKRQNENDVEKEKKNTQTEDKIRQHGLQDTQTHIQ